MRNRYFLEYRPSSSNIHRFQVPSRVWAWFNDSAGDITFYQMFFRQTESIFFLHESILLHFMFEFSLAIISEMLSNGTKNNQQRNKHSLFSLEGLQLTFFCVLSSLILSVTIILPLCIKYLHLHVNLILHILYWKSKAINVSVRIHRLRPNPPTPTQFPFP